MRVVEVSFYGHDAAIRRSVGGAALVARVSGPAAPSAGEVVRIGVRGTVHADPAPVRD